MVLIDLDDFKTINDRLGHVLGDALLVIVGRRLLACVRPDDTVARFGGDEFALLLRDVSAADATGVLDRVGAALEKPISVGGHDLLVQSSIGVADAAPGADPTELLRRADLAMYAAKERGKGRHARYEPALDRQAANDAQLGGELRLALDRGDFHLLYQPVVRLPDGRPAGAEALVRWQHPERGLIRPGPVHRRRRAHRPDRAAGRRGSSRGLPPGRAVAAGVRGRPAVEGQRQHLRPAAARARLRRARRRRAARRRPARRAADWSR